MLSQGDITGDASIVDWARSYIRKKYSKKGNVFIGLPHRLDRPVSGVIILARTSKALIRLNEAFKQQKIVKHYLAISGNPPPEISGKLIHFLAKDPKMKMAVIDNLVGRESVSFYRLIAQVRQKFLIEIRPVTGRPHQIRVQLAAMGCPIWGDKKYGFPGPMRKGKIALHCRKIEWIHPVRKETMAVVAPIPGNSIWADFFQSIT